MAKIGVSNFMTPKQVRKPQITSGWAGEDIKKEWNMKNKIKVNKDIRNLIIRENECFMTKRTSAIYLGVEYEFEEVSPAEIEELRMKLLKEIDKRSWAQIIYDRIFSK